MLAGQVGYFMSRTCFHPLCLHLQRNLFVRRMQELLLPATAYAESSLCSSHKGHLEFAGACKESAYYVNSNWSKQNQHIYLKQTCKRGRK